MFEEEQVKYYKKKDQSSKASKKSKHKHIYDKHILIKYQHMFRECYQVKQYCSICGKIGNDEYNFSFNEGHFKFYTFEELKELYPNAIIVDAPDYKTALWADNISEFGLIKENENEVCN